MATNQQADNVPEKQTQDEPTPSSDQENAEETEAQQVADKSQEASEAPAGDSGDGELPKEVSDRTKQRFEKLTRQLKDYRQRLFELENTPKSEQKEDDIKPLYDPKTGLVDVQALEDLQRRAVQAEKKVKQVESKLTQQQQNTQTRELYDAYPELKNPQSEKDEEFFNEAERIWLHSQAYPERYDGEPLSQKQAADLAKKRMGSSETKTEKEDSSEEKQEAKEQASLGASGKPTQGVQGKVQNEEDYQELIRASRDKTHPRHKQAVIERMRRIREAQSEEK